MRIKTLFFLLLVVCFFCSTNVSAQFRWEYGVTWGPSNYLGDLGAKGDALKLGKTNINRFGNVQWSETKYGLGAYTRYRMHPRFALKVGFTYLKIEGDDQYSLSEGRKARNLSFKNDLFETAFTGEYYFFQSNDISMASRTGIIGGARRKDFAAYLFTGVAGIYSNPKANYKGSWVELNPLQTEGVKYSKVILAVPVGIGFLYSVNRQWKFGFEVNYRQTFTDYLDDVSTVYKDPTTFSDPTAAALSNRRGELTDPKLPDARNYGYQFDEQSNTWLAQKRGDPDHNDAYITGTVTLGYAIRGKRSFFHVKYRHLTKGANKFKKRRGRAKF